MTDSRGNSPGQMIYPRRSESTDAPEVTALAKPWNEEVFGRVNVLACIEKSVLSVTLCNDSNEILGYAALFDAPNHPDIDPAAWDSWMHSYYKSEQTSPLNSLFLVYFAAKEEFKQECAKEIIHTVFNVAADIHYLFLVVPTNVYPDSSLSHYFKPLPLTNDANKPASCVIFTCPRHNHVPVLYIRAAKIQDNDDLVPLFNRQSDSLRRTYGEFFLAELIEAQDDGHPALVAEVDGTASAFMSLSRDINLELLNECFDLEPLHGLSKPHPDDVLPDPIVEPETKPPSRRSDRSGEREGEGAQPEAPASDEPTDEAEMEGEKSGDPTELKAECDVSRKLSDASLQRAQIMSRSYSDIMTNIIQSELESRGPRDSSGRSHVKLSPRARQRPQYAGESDAFCIQLFAIDPQHEWRSVDFMKKAFECFPDCNYCIITIPQMSPEFQLLQQFVRIPPLPGCTLRQELYVYHRAALLKSIRVRQVVTADLAKVKKLTRTLRCHPSLLRDLEQFCKYRRNDDGTLLRAVVAECVDQIVGVALVRQEENIEYIRSHYNIEDFIYFNHHRRDEHLHLHHFVLNPAFNCYSKFFIKEMLRLFGKTCLYCPIFPLYASQEALDQHSLSDCLNDLIPIRSRRQIQYPNMKDLTLDAPIQRVLDQQEPFALNHFNKKLLYEPKTTINAAIVVVGASDAALAFLETLAFSPHLRFNNIVLISPHGLPGELPPDRLRWNMRVDRLNYPPELLATLSLRSWVNIVYGKVTQIDRKRKLVRVNKKDVVPYDHLVLCTGQQFQVFRPNEALLSNPADSSLEQRWFASHDGPLPINVFTINTDIDAEIAIKWLKERFVHSKAAAIVYGATLDSLCCIQALLEMGVEGYKILFVIPPAEKGTQSFLHPESLDEFLMKSLNFQGVTVFRDHALAQWDMEETDDGRMVTKATFMDPAGSAEQEPAELDCGVFFYMTRRGIDFDVFRAINDSCIIFDGALSINTAFLTNDAAIRGAGPLTKFKRTYRTDRTHADFNSREIGFDLAREMLKLFDAAHYPEAEEGAATPPVLPVYTDPIKVYAYLPGGYHYLHVTKPNTQEPVVLSEQAENVYQREIVTGDPDSEGGYCRLYLNHDGLVESITCLSAKEIKMSNILSLYGLHEKLLGHLCRRFDDGEVADLYTYLENRSLAAIYHDRFGDFLAEIRQLLATNTLDATPGSFENKIREMLDDGVQLTKVQRGQLIEEFRKSKVKKTIERRLLSYLSYNNYHLPMYARPSMV